MSSTAPLDFEHEAWERGLSVVVGLDEAGRGPLAGPVVAAAVVLRRGDPFEGVTDSKLLSSERRSEFAVRIRQGARACSLGAASVAEVERLNPRGASSLAMRRALTALPLRAELLLVDGRPLDGLGDHRAIVRGDARCHSIACASILAKVVRDRLMKNLHPRYPEYGWESNVGYGTPGHLEALRRHGPTPHHRRSFRPVAQAELGLERG